MVEYITSVGEQDKSHQQERPEWSSGLSQSCWELAKCNSDDSKTLMALGIAKDFVTNWWAPEMTKGLSQQCSNESKCSAADNKILEKVGQATIDHAFDEMKYNPDPSLWEYSNGKLSKAGDMLVAKYRDDGAISELDLGTNHLSFDGNKLTVTETRRDGGKSSETFEVKGIHLNLSEIETSGRKQEVAKAIVDPSDKMAKLYGTKALNVAEAVLWTAPEKSHKQ